MKILRLLIQFSGAILVFGAVTTANAAVTTLNCSNSISCTMDELFNNNGSITVDDKVFNNFSLDVVAPFSIVPDWTKVIVTGLDDGGLNPGPGLAVDGGAEFVASGGNRVDFLYSFDVTVTNPSLRIVDNSVEVASGAFDVGIEGRWEVEEFVSAGGSDLGSKFIFADGFLSTQQLIDTLAFSPQTSISAATVVYVEDFVGEIISLDGYTQRFSLVPVPAALWLFVSGLTGLAGLAVRARRRTPVAII